MSRPAIFLALALGLLASCGPSNPAYTEDAFHIANPHDGLWQDAEEPPFRFVLEQTFGEEDGVDEAMLGGVGPAAVDAAGNVYIIDYQGNRLVSFGPDGTFRWESGREGEGPGEFQRPRGLHFDGQDLLYVANLSGRRLDRFDLNGEYLDSHETEDFNMRGFNPVLGALDPSTLVISADLRGTFGADIGLLSTGDEWSVTSRFTVHDSLDVEIADGFGGPMPASLSRGQVVVGSTGRYRLLVFSPDGTPRREVTRAGIDMEPPYFSAAGNAVMMRFFSQVSVTAALDDFTIVRGYWPTRIDDPATFMEQTRAGERPDAGMVTTIDFYDREWRLLYSFSAETDDEAAPLVQILTTGPDDRFYSRMPGGVQVGRYRMEVVAP